MGMDMYAGDESKQGLAVGSKTRRGRVRATIQPTRARTSLRVLYNRQNVSATALPSIVGT